MEKRFCSHCGRETRLDMRGAETNMMFYMMFYGDQSTIPYGSEYDKKTGKRQYCPHYQCPLWEKKLFRYSPHDEYFVDEIFVEVEFGKWATKDSWLASF